MRPWNVFPTVFSFIRCHRVTPVDGFGDVNMYDKLTPERFAELKKVKLAGSIGLTHKPVLPDIKLFITRPEGWLDDLRRLRETMAFKPGPSKRRLASSESEEEVEGTENVDGTDSKQKTTNKKSTQTSRRPSTTAATKLANSKLSTDDQATLLALFGTTSKRKKNGT